MQEKRKQIAAASKIKMNLLLSGNDNINNNINGKYFNLLELLMFLCTSRDNFFSLFDSNQHFGHQEKYMQKFHAPEIQFFRFFALAVKFI